MRSINMRSTISILLLTIFVCGVAAAQQFQPPVYYRASGSGSFWTGAVSADFNHDGSADIAVIETNSGEGFVFLNQGDGTFKAAPKFRLRSATVGMAVADLNEDGNPDLVTLEDGGALSGPLEVLLGNGDGTFTRGNHYRIGTAPKQVVVADFNGDGHADVAVVNNKSGGVMVFNGDGHGNLGTPAKYRGANFPVTIAAADVNGDGHPDLLVAGTTGTLAVLLNNGSGIFTNGSSVTIDKGPVGIAVADLNHDGKLDVAISGDPVDVLLGNGDGTFGAAVPYSSGSPDPRGIVIADFNKDGNPDVAVVTLNDGIQLYYGNGNGTLQVAVIIVLPALGDNAIVAADFDKDGAPDIALNTGVGRMAVLMNTQ